MQLHRQVDALCDSQVRITPAGLDVDQSKRLGLLDLDIQIKMNFVRAHVVFEARSVGLAFFDLLDSHAPREAACQPLRLPDELPGVLDRRGDLQLFAEMQRRPLLLALSALAQTQVRLISSLSPFGMRAGRRSPPRTRRGPHAAERSRGVAQPPPGFLWRCSRPARA